MLLTTLLGTMKPLRSTQRSFAILILALSAAVLPQAQAGTIQVSNFAQPQNTSAAVGGFLGDVYLATSFITGNHGYWLESAGAIVRNPGSVDLTVELSLWTDAANLPGTQIYIFPTSFTLAAGANNTAVSSTASGVPLAANTAYWLAMRGTAGDALTWVSTQSFNQTSPSGWTISDVNVHDKLGAAVPWTIRSSVNPVIPILGIEASTVPEPGSFILSAVGLAAGCVVLRVRRKAGRQ